MVDDYSQQYFCMLSNCSLLSYAYAIKGMSFPSLVYEERAWCANHTRSREITSVNFGENDSSRDYPE